MTTLQLIRALSAALDGEDPETSLSAGLSLLREHGLRSDVPGPAWLSLKRGKRELRLVYTGGAEPDADTAAVLSSMLGAALSRAYEGDELQTLAERHQLLSEASFEGIVIHVDGEVIDNNARLCELLGCEREDVLGPGALARFMAPEDLEKAQARIRDRIAGGFVVTLVRKDGSRFRAEFNTKQGRLGVRPVRVATLRDVTQEERTAELLRESEQRLRHILEETFDNVVTTRDGIVLDIRGRRPPFFGVSAERLVGSSVMNYIAPLARSDLAQRIQEQAVGKYEITALTPEGEQVPVEVVSVISTLDGGPVRVAGLRDLREARRAEAERQRLANQIERSQRLESLGVLASGLAHDFNNLLVGILGSAELLLMQLDDPELRAIAEAILTAGERAAGLTRQMLIYAGRRELRAPEPVDVAALWVELRGLLDAALSRRASIELDLAPGSVVLGERATLMQVLMNLLTNASDALEGKPGSIRVSTRRVRELAPKWNEALGAALRGNEWILIEVSDTGVGMDEATRARIFEPFFTTKLKGHGLGLGACLGIVASHGGGILVESTKGQGSTFSLALPAAELGPARAAQAAPRPSPCRVLIVDDEALVRAHARRLLEQQGFVVSDVDSAAGGLARLSGGDLDLVILDLSMPDMDGVEVVRRMREAGSTVPVVLCSGDLDAATIDRLAHGMVHAFLHKPFTGDELLAAIAAARR